jgi:hypothetical protein
LEEAMIDRYAGKDNYGKPKSDYLAKIALFDEARLYDECRDKIWFSAYAANNPKSDFHWHCDACYDECVKRDKVDEIYSQAYEDVMKANGG